MFYILHYLVPHFLFHYALLVKYKDIFTYTFYHERIFYIMGCIYHHYLKT